MTGVGTLILLNRKLGIITVVVVITYYYHQHHHYNNYCCYYHHHHHYRRRRRRRSSKETKNVLAHIVMFSNFVEVNKLFCGILFEKIILSKTVSDTSFVLLVKCSERETKTNNDSASETPHGCARSVSPPMKVMEFVVVYTSQRIGLYDPF